MSNSNEEKVDVNVSETTEDIDLIVNHPKKAINKLVLPIIFSNLFMVLNNIIDGIWVAGLGSDSLAAVGFVPQYSYAWLALQMVWVQEQTA